MRDTRAMKLNAGDALPEAAADLPCIQYALASANHAHYTKLVHNPITKLA